MEWGDFFFVFIFLGIAAIAGVIYLVKMAKAKKSLEEADEAMAKGDDSGAIVLYKQALKHANEKPDMEVTIVSKLDGLFNKNQLEYNFSDYNTLIEQARVLRKKSSNKALRELGKVIKLKKEMVDKMPSLS